MCLSSLSPPAPSETCPLLPFEEDQLHRLRSAFSSAPVRVRRAFFGLDTNPYQWLDKEQMEMLE